MSFLLHDPLWRPLDDNGAVMPGCYFEFYETGTTTPATVYADADLGTPLGAVSGELIANAAGRFPAIYGDSAIVYRRQLYDADDTLIEDTDPLHPSAQHPAGSIVMFYGDATARDAAYPPALWELCDGDNSTPDMRGRVPIGADGTTYVADGTGYGSAPGNATSSSNGAHTHSGATGSTTLTESQIPAHRHLLFVNAIVSGTLTNANQAGYASNTGGDTEYSLNASSTDATIGRSAEAGGGTGHTHTIGSDGAHTHTVAIPLPPCRALWFLMRLP